MAEVIYSSQRSGFEPGRIYRNPRFFQNPMVNGVDQVVVIGDWPKVVDAYTKLGIPVVVAQTPSDLAKDSRKAVPTPRTTPERPAARPEPSVPETAYLPTAEPREAQEAVDLPATVEEWDALPWPTRKSLGSQVSDQPIINGDDAKAAYLAEMERRG